MKSQSLKDVIELAEIGDPYAYSGRGMMGSYCLAINVDSTDTGSFFADLLEMVVRLLKEATSPEEIAHATDSLEVIQEAFRSHRTDRMGHGMVVYFPDEPAPEGDSEEDEDEDDEGDSTSHLIGGVPPEASDDDPINPEDLTGYPKG